MMARQIGCQVATTRLVQRPPYFGHFHLGVDKTPLVSQRNLSLPDCQVGGPS
jgi:hypothetical protein